MNRRTALLLILAVATLLYGYRLGFPDFWGNHWESRRAEIGRNMLETGDYVVPRQNGRVTLNKPPLYYWLMAGAMAITRNHAELGARLPSAVAGVAALAVVWRLGTILAGGAAGLFAALLLLGNVLYFGHARTAEMDMVLLAVEAGAVLAFLEARRRKRRRVLPWLGWILLAAGFLIKGPVGILVPVTVIAVYRLADRFTEESPAGGWIRPFGGLVLFAVLVVPWFLIIFHRLPDAWEIFRRETVTRYGGELDHQEPFWFYLPVILGGFLPGTLFLPVWARQAKPGETNLAASHLRRLAVTVGLLFAFFSLSVSKRIYYLLPLWPLLAVGCGIALEQARRRGPTRWLSGPVTLLAAVLALVPAAAALTPEIGGPPFFVRNAVAYTTLALLSLTAIWGFLRSVRGDWIRGLVAGVAALLLGSFFMVQSVGPVSNAYRSRVGFARQVAARVPPGKSLYMFRQSNFSIPFYARRVIPDLPNLDALKRILSGRDSILLIVNRNHIRYLRENGFRVEPLYKQLWTPPGRPHHRRYLALARVRRI